MSTVITALYYLAILFFGSALGSFLNSWVWRTRENLGITTARSMCPHCRHPVKWYDNIPVLSFFLLKGSCRNCDRTIIWQYPAVEAWMGLAFLGVAIFHHIDIWHFSVEILRDWTILVFLTFIFLYDLKYKEILSFPTIPTSIVLFVFSIGFGWHTWQSMLLGIVVGAGFFLLLYVVSKGTWIGGGDVRLGVFMGTILGWPMIVVALLLSYVIGAATSLALIGIKKKKWKDETAFGTYLVIGTIIAMFWGYPIVHWYMQLL